MSEENEKEKAAKNLIVAIKKMEQILGDKIGDMVRISPDKIVYNIYTIGETCGLRPQAPRCTVVELLKGE